MILGLIFKFLIHFEFIFVYGMRWSNFLLLHITIQFSKHDLLRDCYFPIVYSWHFCLKLTKHRALWSFLFLFGKAETQMPRAVTNSIIRVILTFTPPISPASPPSLLLLRAISKLNDCAQIQFKTLVPNSPLPVMYAVQLIPAVRSLCYMNLH